MITAPCRAASLEGYCAQRAGRPRHDNPYGAGTPRAAFWRCGWWRAFHHGLRGAA